MTTLIVTTNMHTRMKVESLELMFFFLVLGVKSNRDSSLGLNLFLNLIALEGEPIYMSDFLRG